MKRKDMVHFYEFVEHNFLFKQLSVDDLLFTNYDCPLVGSPVDYYAKKNYFCYIYVGGGRWKTPTEEYTLKAGDAAFLKKGPHRVYKILNGDFCALLIFVPDEFIASVIKNDCDLEFTASNIQNTDCVIPLNLDETLNDYFETLLHYFRLPKSPSKSLLKIKFKELIVNVATGGNNPKATDYFKEISSSRKKALKPIMDEHYLFNLKLKEFAKLSGRSLATFNRDFLKLYKTTPGKWLKHKRLEYGRFLLETTDLNVNEVALDIGFENTSHFIKSFKAQYQSSPLRFKKQLMGKQLHKRG
ncbi:helix-turn-helix domain-containing protein [uncultured Allomuricauda sp.]|uniref:helix-turn-helix domain-containing protein n=1 Tax=Flagellimonas sp. W118 TaxID=3410791 RepID=UPI002626FDF4|nr:AraC family transcriptional regulator [uncultured Allomuricauda sp.]